MVSQAFFNDLVTSKQVGFEIIVLLAAALLVLTVPFQKLISITLTDILVAPFAGWQVFNQYVTKAPFTINQKHCRKILDNLVKVESLAMREIIQEMKIIVQGFEFRVDSSGLIVYSWLMVDG